MEKLPGHPGLKEEGRVLCRNGILTITLMLPLSSMVSKTETNTKNFCYKIMEKSIFQENLQIRFFESTKSMKMNTLHCNFQFHNGWIEAALESSIRNLIKIYPDEYEKQFGQGIQNIQLNEMTYVM